MQRRITTTFLALSLLLSLALWSAGRNVKATTMLAASSQLNPTAFTSLGASPFTTAGTYLIDASRNNAAPTLTELGLAAPIVGVFYSPSSGVVLRDELAVFTFNALTIPTGVTVQGVRNANSRPLALLSQSTITLDGTLDVSGPGGGAASGKIGGVGGNAGPGGGGGGGGDGFGSTAISGGLGFTGGNDSSQVQSLGSGGNGGSVVAGGGGGVDIALTAAAGRLAATVAATSTLPLESLTATYR